MGALPPGARTQITVAHRAFEKRHDDPARDYGIGSVELQFALIGPAGAITVGVSTGWYLPHVEERLLREHDHTPFMGRRSCAFQGAGTAVCIHAPSPRKDYFMGPDDCHLLPGGQCWGDIGFLAGDEAYAVLVEGGEDALWEFLASWYRAHLLDEPEDPVPGWTRHMLGVQEMERDRRLRARA